jgi:Protein of unknown function (DUF3592)
MVRTLGTGLCVVGSLMLSLSLVMAVRTEQFLRRSVATHGRVVENVELVDRDSRTYAPVFEFADAAGKMHRVQSRVSSNPPDFAVGQPIGIRYERNDVEDARPDSFGQLWAISVVLGVAGAVMLGMGLVALRFVRR